ncbi:GIY-YIG nuclease family protein [Psychrobacter sp. 230]|uniref:GIY-YIG nuclease family protein n=1 Tax=Psychrobacter sp. 230 TaxID=2555884 RepID=UPI0010684506|nr:GIY-YIG nuclease family protein [Psychrobacter sp. 230]TEW83157.1 GIY-YIG nuclease family protein [Psychrobacter sp. 230]
MSETKKPSEKPIVMIKLDEIYQSREYKTLEDIFSNDSTGLLDDVKPITKSSANNSVLTQQFNDINNFIDKHGRRPSSSASDINEKISARLLATIQTNHANSQELLALDKHGLLSAQTTASTLSDQPTLSDKSMSNKDDDGSKKAISDSSKETEPVVDAVSELPVINSLDDIFNSDDLGIFDNIHSEILVNDHQSNTRASYDQYNDEDIASRFECKDFYKFEAMFERISKAIQTGAFTKTNFSSVKAINIGSVFVLNGMLCYVANIYKAEARKNTRSQERLRLIFSNGTESNMLTYSLATAQYKYENSYQLLITDPDWMDDELAKNFGDDRQLTGVIYVAKLTETPNTLAHYKHLHKVGFSTLTGEARTKHSVRDTAFLQQPVDIIAEWQVYDANARSVEGVLHAFFYDQRVKVSLKAANDNLYKATEWFNVPLAEIEKAINLVIAGDIKDYRMDSAAGKVVLK